MNALVFLFSIFTQLSDISSIDASKWSSLISQEPTKIEIQFNQDILDIKSGSPLFFNGSQIGTVSNLTELDSNYIIEAEVNSLVSLRKNTFVALSSKTSLTSSSQENFIQLIEVSPKTAKSDKIQGFISHEDFWKASF